MLEACRWSGAMPLLYDESKLAHSIDISIDESLRVMIIPVPHRGQCHGGHGACSWFACLGTGSLTGQQDPAEGEPACTMPVGEESKMTDANEPFGQHMQKEAA